MISPRLIDGSASARSRSNGLLEVTVEMTGNQRSSTANAISSRMPETNAGNDRPASETMRASQSTKPSRRWEATTPSGTPMRVPITSAASVSSIVYGSTAATSVVIGRLLTSERPRSPRAIWAMKSAYWARIGLSRPSRWRNAARAAGVAWSPRTTIVGSPGTTRTSTNTSVSTAQSVGSASSSRLTTKRSMSAPRPRSLLGGQLRDLRAEVDRVDELVAEVDVRLVRPDLELLEQRHRAHLLQDLALRRRPELLLLGEIGLGARGVDLLVGDRAMREVDDRGRRADDRARVEELRQRHVGDGKARRRVVHRTAQVLADVGVERLVIDRLELQVDAGELELRLDDLRGVEHRRQRRLDRLHGDAVRVARLLQQRLRLGDVVGGERRLGVGAEVAGGNDRDRRVGGEVALEAHDLLAVDRVRNRLPHALVVERLDGHVEVQHAELGGPQHVDDHAG